MTSPSDPEPTMFTDRVMSPAPVERPGDKRRSMPLSYRVVLASGWTRRLVAFLAGASGALAMAPIGFFPAMADYSIEHAA